MCPIVPTFTCGLLRSNFSFAIFPSSSGYDCGLRVLIYLRKLQPQLRRDLFELREVHLAHLALVRRGQLVPQRAHALAAAKHIEQTGIAHLLELPDAQAPLAHALQEPLYVGGSKRAFEQRFRFREPRFVPDRELCLFEHRLFFQGSATLRCCALALLLALSGARSALTRPLPNSGADDRD